MSSTLFGKTALRFMSTQNDGDILLRVLAYIGNNQSLSNFAITFTAATAATKTGPANGVAVAGGILQRIAASTALPALTGMGTIPTGSKVQVVFTVDSQGNLGVYYGPVSTAVAGCTFPSSIPLNVAVLGSMLLETATNPFIGGTTNLDATGVTLSFGGFIDVLPVSSI